MKLTKHAWILWGISLIVFLVFAFVIPFTHTDTFGLALGATLMMFGVAVFVFARAFNKNETLESKLLGWPIFKVGYTALIVQIIVGFILMGIAALCPVWAAVIAEVVVFAATAFCLTVKDAAREVVTAAEVKVTDNTAAWKAIRAKAYAMPDKVREALRYADPIPTSIDCKIEAAIEVKDADVVLQLLEQRKVLAKEGKKNCY